MTDEPHDNGESKPREARMSRASEKNFRELMSRWGIQSRDLRQRARAAARVIELFGGEGGPVEARWSVRVEGLELGEGLAELKATVSVEWRKAEGAEWEMNGEWTERLNQALGASGAFALLGATRELRLGQLGRQLGRALEIEASKVGALIEWEGATTARRERQALDDQEAGASAAALARKARAPRM